MLEGRRMEVGEAMFVLFAARGAAHAPERPRREADGAQQRPSAAVELAAALEDRQLRRADAERTAVLSRVELAIERSQRAFSEPLRVRLQDHLWEELVRG